MAELCHHCELTPCHVCRFHLRLSAAQERFSSRISVISRPPDCDTATLRGAAQYGLAGRPLVSSVIAPQAYMMKVRRLYSQPA